jgi:FdhD protein
MDRPSSKTAVQVIRVAGGEVGRARRDDVATEEPLEIRLVTGGAPERVAVTMRTPGADFELAAGFLYSEGVIRERDDLRAMSYCVDAELDEAQRYNVVNVALARPPAADLSTLERHFTMTSACGVCGKASIEGVMRRVPPVAAVSVRVSARLVTELPYKLREAQRLFETTGGLHAAALFDVDGRLLALREDVGRHNAMDKVIGWALMGGRLPLRETIILVSGRASYELVQKAAVSGIPILCAISAPSSLAIATARAAGMTLIGFLRDDRFNLYCGEGRVVVES